MPEGIKVLDKCPSCGRKDPIYVVYATVPPTSSMREYGQRWVKIAWQGSIDYPEEIRYTRDCDRRAGTLEKVRCSACGYELEDEDDVRDFVALMSEIVGRVRLENDEEMIRYLKELRPGHDYGPDATVQIPDLTISRNRLLEYLRECEFRLRRYGLNRDWAYSHQEHDWRNMLRFIRQAEQLGAHNWPPKQEGKPDDLGIAIVQLTPKEQSVVRSGHPMSRRAEFSEDVRVAACGMAYYWKLSHPDQCFTIRQIGDFSNSGLF